MAYSSGTLSLAALEYLVHVDADNAPADLVALTLTIPDALRIDHVHRDALPKGWQETVDVAACRAIGDAWLASQSSGVLAVPSATVVSEHNYLINPARPDARAIVSQQPFAFDPR